jgi:uncharacterized membrane protein (DUF485 family)
MPLTRFSLIYHYFLRFLFSSCHITKRFNALLKKRRCLCKMCGVIFIYVYVYSLFLQRFSVAERPILYLALCQVLYSIGVIIGSTSSVSCFVDKVSGSNLLASGGMVPSSCALVFLLTYFFGMATSMW